MFGNENTRIKEEGGEVVVACRFRLMDQNVKFVEMRISVGRSAP